MRRKTGRNAGEYLHPLRFGNDWIEVLNSQGGLERVEPDRVRLEPKDMHVFAERDTELVGEFWLDWRIEDEAFIATRRLSRKARCPRCGRSVRVTRHGRLWEHAAAVGRRRALVPNPDFCIGTGFLVWTNRDGFPASDAMDEDDAE